MTDKNKPDPFKEIGDEIDRLDKQVKTGKGRKADLRQPKRTRIQKLEDDVAENRELLQAISDKLDGIGQKVDQTKRSTLRNRYLLQGRKKAWKELSRDIGALGQSLGKMDGKEAGKRVKSIMEGAGFLLVQHAKEPSHWAYLFCALMAFNFLTGAEPKVNPLEEGASAAQYVQRGLSSGVLSIRGSETKPTVEIPGLTREVMVYEAPRTDIDLKETGKFIKFLFEDPKSGEKLMEFFWPPAEDAPQKRAPNTPEPGPAA